MKESIKEKVLEEFGIDEQQYNQIYNYLYDEYGYAVEMWGYSRIEIEVKQYLDIYEII